MIEVDTEAFLQALTRSGRPQLYAIPVRHARSIYRDSLAKLDSPAPALRSIDDLRVPGYAETIGSRLYFPNGLAHQALVVFFHGGGWTIGDLDSHHNFCASLADQLKARVLAVDYRLAPEHPFPAAHDDCRAVVKWAATSPPELGPKVSC